MKGCSVLVIALIFSLVVFAFAQGDVTSRPSFEVASIKPSPPSDLGQRWDYLPGGRFNAQHVTLKILVMQAHEVQDFRISGGPQWMDASPTSNDRYDIDAKADHDASRSEVRQMLRTLLEDRFKLIVHREMVEREGYALVVGKNGHKLGPPQNGEAKDSRFSGGGCHVIAEKTSMSELATYLGYVVNRRMVWDKTGLNGRFNFTFDCVPEAIRVAGEREGQDKEVSGERRPEGLSVFAALEQRLGLKLEAVKGPVEIIVVDHAEKLTKS